MDFPTPEELIAHGRTVEQIREFLEVDSLAYLSLEGMLGCLSDAAENHCAACWSGNYPMSMDMVGGKYGLEHNQLEMF